MLETSTTKNANGVSVIDIDTTLVTEKLNQLKQLLEEVNTLAGSINKEING